MSIPLYINILRLHSFNQELLKLYYTLFSKVKEATLEKDLGNRIGVRESIQLQLIECIEKLQTENASVPDRILYYGLPTFVRLECRLQIPLQEADWNNCYKLEIKNVNHYYEALYSEKLPHEMTDILLQQKDKIEEFLIKI